jgi:hypothetical protein
MITRRHPETPATHRRTPTRRRESPRRSIRSSRDHRSAKIGVRACGPYRCSFPAMNAWLASEAEGDCGMTSVCGATVVDGLRGFGLSCRDRAVVSFVDAEGGDGQAFSAARGCTQPRSKLRVTDRAGMSVGTVPFSAGRVHHRFRWVLVRGHLSSSGLPAESLPAQVGSGALVGVARSSMACCALTNVVFHRSRRRPWVPNLVVSWAQHSEEPGRRYCLTYRTSISPISLWGTKCLS